MQYKETPVKLSTVCRVTTKRWRGIVCGQSVVIMVAVSRTKGAVSGEKQKTTFLWLVCYEMFLSLRMEKQSCREVIGVKERVCRSGSNTYCY